MVNVLHVGYANKSQTGERLQQGYEIELEAAAVRLRVDANGAPRRRPTCSR